MRSVPRSLPLRRPLDRTMQVKPSLDSEWARGGLGSKGSARPPCLDRDNDDSNTHVDSRAIPYMYVPAPAPYLFGHDALMVTIWD